MRNTDTPARGWLALDLVFGAHGWMKALVPPHNYLATYFWLRHHFGAQAIVHNGKHGNLEWLPGKALALSDGCWPEVVLPVSTGLWVLAV